MPLQDIPALFQIKIFQNTLQAYVFALGIFLVLSLIFVIVQKLISHYLEQIVKRTKTDIDDLFLDVFEKIGVSLYLYLAFYIAVQTLQFSKVFNTAFTVILFALIIYKAVHSLQLVIDYSLAKYLHKEKNTGTQGALKNIAGICKVLLWIFGVFLLLSNVGINVTSLLAGLGIGGIALALAAQNILGDLFSSFVIYFDKPFVVGDFIIVGDKMGVVEKIGIKTTRIHALQGEEIVISNKDLTSSQLQNFKKMKERRVVFSFGVIYETPQEKLKKIPGTIKKIITEATETRFDRAHFLKFDGSALYFEVVYYVTSSDYNVYMDIQQEINFAIRDAFKKENIVMAYPTQTVYIGKN